MRPAHAARRHSRIAVMLSHSPGLNADGRTRMVGVESLDEMAACMRVRRNGYLLKGRCCRARVAPLRLNTRTKLSERQGEHGIALDGQLGLRELACQQSLGADDTTRIADSADLAGGAWQKREGVLGRLATRHERAIENVELLADGRSVAWVLGAAGRVVTVLGASSPGQVADRIASQQLTGVANVILFVDKSPVLVVARRSDRDVVVDGFQICNRIAPKRAKT